MIPMLPTKSMERLFNACLVHLQVAGILWPGELYRPHHSLDDLLPTSEKQTPVRPPEKHLQLWQAPGEALGSVHLFFPSH